MEPAPTPSDVVAALALFLSVYATWKTVQFNDRQRSLIESQKQLNERLLAKEDDEAQVEQKADLGVAFIRLGRTNYRLKIWNKGKAPARNVTFEPLGESHCFIQSDIDEKFPLEVLEIHQSVELFAAVGMGTKSKHQVKLCWSDAFSVANEKVFYPTL